MRVMARSVLILAAFGLSGCIVNYFDFGSLFKVQPLQETKVSGKGRQKILLLDISGVINEEEGGGIAPKPNMVSRVKEELTKASADPNVRGVVLRINSPGGTVTASDIIYQEVENFKKRTGRKVVASILDIGASGAYYISMAADRILANPTSVTGSIGVIMLHVNVQGLLEKIGVTTQAIKSGPHKDMGSPLKPLAPEDRELLQGVIDDLYARFLGVVQSGRPQLSPDQVRTLADGRVYTADQALKAGLVDEIGYLEQGIEEAKKLAGLKDAEVIMYIRPDEAKGTIYAQASALLNPPPLGVDLKRIFDLKSPKFMYLWMP